MGKIVEKKFEIKNGEFVILRSAIQADSMRLNDLANEVFKTSDYLITTADEFSSFSEEQQKERIKKYEEDDGSILLVAEYGEELIGMIDFQNGKRKRIAHKGALGMSVRSSWRNKGIGNVLLSGLIEWVRNHSTIEVINLGVIEENKSAVSLYSKMGFEITGREPFGVKLADGRFLADLAMSLRVKK
jgi:ribosomal protein S18 acetylase RimI-like enzyme